MLVAKEYFQKSIRGGNLNKKYNREGIEFEWYCVRSL